MGLQATFQIRDACKVVKTARLGNLSSVFLAVPTPLRIMIH